jgi:hypothetical protein
MSTADNIQGYRADAQAPAKPSAPETRATASVRTGTASFAPVARPAQERVEFSPLEATAARLALIDG